MLFLKNKSGRAHYRLQRRLEVFSTAHYLCFIYFFLAAVSLTLKITKEEEYETNQNTLPFALDLLFIEDSVSFVLVLSLLEFISLSIGVMVSSKKIVVIELLQPISLFIFLLLSIKQGEWESKLQILVESVSLLVLMINSMIFF